MWLISCWHGPGTFIPLWQWCNYHWRIVYYISDKCYSIVFAASLLRTKFISVTYRDWCAVYLRTWQGHENLFISIFRKLTTVLFIQYCRLNCSRSHSSPCSTSKLWWKKKNSGYVYSEQQSRVSGKVHYSVIQITYWVDTLFNTVYTQTHIINGMYIIW